MKGQTTLKLFKDQVQGKLIWLLFSWGLLLLIALIALTGCVSAVPEEVAPPEEAVVEEEAAAPKNDPSVSPVS